MRRLFVIIVLLLGLICSAVPQDAEAANWVWVTSTDYATISIDSLGVRGTGGDIYFWDKWEYIDSAERDNMISQLTENHRSHGDYTDFSDLRTIKHHAHFYRASNGTIYGVVLGSAYYDSQGMVIYSIPDSAYVKWNSIPPDSIGEAEYLAALHYARR